MHYGAVFLRQRALYACGCSYRYSFSAAPANSNAGFPVAVALPDPPHPPFRMEDGFKSFRRVTLYHEPAFDERHHIKGEWLAKFRPFHNRFAGMDGYIV